MVYRMMYGLVVLEYDVRKVVPIRIEDRNIYFFLIFLSCDFHNLY